ncbi:hypothetical protein PAXRUDRAFT_805601, partial [Paxillus rubicundulus Ve08.2h10]
MLPFQWIKKWMGTFFEDSSLCLVGIVLHLGHCSQPCPAGVPQGMDSHANGVPFPVDDMEWCTDEPDDVPPFLQVLQVLQGGNFLTLVDVTGIHFLWVHYCVCLTSQPFHMQLLKLGLLPATIDQP